MHIVVLLVVGVGIFAPWTLRNWIVYRTFIPTNAASGFNMLVGNHPGASGEQEPYAPLPEYVEKYGYIEANRRANQEAVSFILGNPVEFIKLVFYRASIYFSFGRPTGFWFHLHGFSKIATLILSALYSAILFIAGSWGVYRLWDLKGGEYQRALILLAMLIMMPLALISIVVETRYRFLSYPFFAIFAGLALADLWYRRLAFKPMAIVASILLANTAFDILRNLSRIIERVRGL